jgi:hypothetical protein
MTDDAKLEVLTDLAAQATIDQAVAAGRLIRFIGEDGKRCVIEIEKSTPEMREAAARLLEEQARGCAAHADELRRFGEERQP